NHAEWRVFGKRQAMIATQAVGLEKFDAGNKFDDFQLFNLVIEPADLGFFKLQPAEFFGLLSRDAPDALDGLAAVFEPALGELFKSSRRCLDCLIDRFENAPGSVA